MHELGILFDIAEVVTKTADKYDVKKIKGITLDVGELQGIVPEIFDDIFPYVARQYPVLEEAKLNVNFIPGNAECVECGTIYNVMEHDGKCSKCKSEKRVIISGTELIVRNIEY